MTAEIVPFGNPDPAPLPHNDEAEQSLLGAIFANNRAFHLVADLVRPEHFFVGVHGRIYEAIEAMILAGHVATPVTLKGAFDRDGSLAEIGGAQYLARLAASAVTIVGARDYAAAVVECWKRRRLIDIAARLAEAASDEGLDNTSDQAIYAAEEQFHQLSAISGGALVPLGSSLDRAIVAAEEGYKAGGKPRGLLTGLADLDDALGGLHKGTLVIVAGRPSMGKTALAANIARHVAQNGAPAIFASLEMSGEQLAQRILAGDTGVSADLQQRGQIDADQMAALIDARARLSDIPLYIDDTPAVSVLQLRARAIRHQRRHGLALVAVDYLQLMIGGREENRTQEISKITRDLKVMAKELGVPVVALSQLSRAVEQREDKRPQLSDLRESGSIEQDADVVMFVYRDEYYLKNAEPKAGDFDDDERFNKRWAVWSERLHKARGVAEVLIRKNRQGPTPTVRLHFDGARARFGNLARGE